jgi:hypothetical protein
MARMRHTKTNILRCIGAHISDQTQYAGWDSDRGATSIDVSCSAAAAAAAAAACGLGVIVLSHAPSRPRLPQPARKKSHRCLVTDNSDVLISVSPIAHASSTNKHNPGRASCHRVNTEFSTEGGYMYKWGTGFHNKQSGHTQKVENQALYMSTKRPCTKRAVGCYQANIAYHEGMNVSLEKHCPTRGPC